MGLFDKMKQAASAAGGNQTVTFTFQELPESLAQMQALPEASLDTPFKTAALTVCALCAYGADAKDIAWYFENGYFVNLSLDLNQKIVRRRTVPRHDPNRG